MDRHGDWKRPSSLPTSLIPHLYAAPRDRDTPTEADDRHLPPVPDLSFFQSSSVTNLPSLTELKAKWREDEARRLPPLQYPIPIEPNSYSYPPVPSLPSGSSPPNYLRQVGSPDIERGYGSESLSVDNERDDAHKDKMHHAHSMDPDDNSKKSSRKTAVACNFCRGRKLRCNGAKPSCYNCTVRKFDCEYVSTQRRRGPGKAPKGSRSRKGRSEQSGLSSHSTDDRLLVPDFEVSPDLRPYTSVISLDTFGFQPPEPSDQRNELMMMGHDSRILEDPSDAKDRTQPGS